MQVIEKVKVVPEGYNGAGMDGYGRRDVNGKANAGLTLGIIGTALGAWALFGNNRRSTGLLGAAGGRSSRSMSPRNEIGFRRNSRRDEEYREDDDRHIMRILGYGYDGDDDRHRSRKHRRDHDEHFDEREAYDTVEEMYHVKGDKKYVGEKFDMDKAHKVYEKLRDADGYTIGDIYVAINAQYHDYCELFEKWFGSNFDEKIIASAVDFWFEDDDFDGNKVWKYFNEM